MIQNKEPVQATLISHQAILATDASKTSRRAKLMISHPNLEIWFHGTWSSNWYLSSSNQSQATGSLCAFRRSENFLREMQIKSLKVETDNCSAVFNINRGSAAIALVKCDPELVVQIINFRRLSDSSRCPHDTGNSQQNEARKSTSCNSGPEQALTTLVAQSSGLSSELCECEQMRSFRKRLKFLCSVFPKYQVGDKLHPTFMSNCPQPAPNFLGNFTDYPNKNIN
ncbi:MAG: hypothetical protein EZS28_038369 [Streblomastix strix]|uniref:Uncharacterized protein n=1 Tax=Streblomastix strix TaxID=222440 RepID=A0A5J4U760_9EUKA|nr:MAG: hypothetical protein EZS28_038369 [Streblomastix strix]